MISRSDSIDLNAIRAGSSPDQADMRSRTSRRASSSVSTHSSPRSRIISSRTPTTRSTWFSKDVERSRSTAPAVPLTEGQAVFVSAGADHRFVGYENLTVLVVFARPHEASAG